MLADGRTMEQSRLFATDTATIAAFDPEVLRSRIGDDCDWWCGDFITLDEMANGDIALVSTGADGVYKVRVTSDALRAAERSYACESVTLGVRVESGQLFVGAGEELPGAGDTVCRTDSNRRGFFVDAPAGLYTVEVFAIRWQDSPEWYAAPGAPAPDSAPGDLVLHLSPRQGAFVPPTVEPRVFGDGLDTWLYPDLTRRLGPEPGMVLTTTVVRRGDALVLKPCGPLSFRPVLPDMTGLEWRDEVKVRVVRVDPLAREFQAELVSGPRLP
jgi:hypothetical protein